MFVRIHQGALYLILVVLLVAFFHAHYQLFVNWESVNYIEKTWPLLIDLGLMVFVLNFKLRKR